jgi:hypothetical protein
MPLTEQDVQRYNELRAQEPDNDSWDMGTVEAIELEERARAENLCFDKQEDGNYTLAPFHSP